MCQLTVLLAVTAVFIAPTLSVDLGSQWKEFKSKYNKTYKNELEELYRYIYDSLLKNPGLGEGVACLWKDNRDLD